MVLLCSSIFCRLLPQIGETLSLPQVGKKQTPNTLIFKQKITSLGMQESRTYKLSVLCVAVVRAKSFRGKYQ